MLASESRKGADMSDEMQKLFKEAAKIASAVPESMQEAAFNRALDMLTGGEQAPDKSTPTLRRSGNKRASPGNADTGTPAVDRVGKVTAITRDSASEVDQESTALGRSIALLVVAEREAGVDGLTAPEIATILTEKFRHKTSRQAVQSAMDTAGNMVDRQKSVGGAAAVYRVMKNGEEWLSKPADQRSGASGGTRSRRRSGGTKTAPAAPAKTTPAAKKTAPAKKSVSVGAGRRVGPKAVLESLIKDGYFSEPRAMADIRQHVRDQRAMNLSNQDLSPTLIRLLREHKLKRSKVENQYVYSAG